jgi:hypothetical protein
MFYNCSLRAEGAAGGGGVACVNATDFAWVDTAGAPTL